MNDIEASLQEFPLISLSSGEFLLTQGEKTDCLYFLHKGAVKILKDGYEVAKRTDNGAVLGEMSIMLDIEHSVSVQCVQDSKFYCIEQPRKFLEKHPNVIWNIAQILSLRLYSA